MRGKWILITVRILPRVFIPISVLCVLSHGERLTSSGVFLREDRQIEGTGRRGRKVFRVLRKPPGTLSYA